MNRTTNLSKYLLYNITHTKTRSDTRMHTHTHTHIYIYIYIYITQFLSTHFYMSLGPPTLLRDLVQLDILRSKLRKLNNVLPWYIFSINKKKVSFFLLKVCIGWGYRLTTAAKLDKKITVMLSFKWIQRNLWRKIVQQCSLKDITSLKAKQVCFMKYSRPTSTLILEMIQRFEMISYQHWIWSTKCWRMPIDRSLAFIADRIGLPDVSFFHASRPVNFEHRMDSTQRGGKISKSYQNSMTDWFSILLYT